MKRVKDTGSRDYSVKQGSIHKTKAYIPPLVQWDEDASEAGTFFFFS